MPYLDIPPKAMQDQLRSRLAPQPVPEPRRAQSPEEAKPLPATAAQPSKADLEPLDTVPFCVRSADTSNVPPPAPAESPAVQTGSVALKKPDAAAVDKTETLPSGQSAAFPEAVTRSAVTEPPQAPTESPAAPVTPVSAPEVAPSGADAAGETADSTILTPRSREQHLQHPPRMPATAAKQPAERAIRSRPHSEPAVQSGSMPVLNAFQSFLDQERKRTKKYIITLALVMIALFAAFLAAGIFIGTAYASRLRSDLANLEVNVSQHEERSGRVNERLDNLSDIAIKLKSDIEAETARNATHRDEIVKVTQNVDDLRNLKDGWSALYTSVGAMQKEIAALRLRLLGTESSALPRPVSKSIPVVITPAGQTNAVNWLMPIPEQE